jgi:putative ABC transport system permease protein
LRFADILQIALAALYHQKVRTLLTLSGVIIGTFALTASIAGKLGFEQEVMRQLSRGSLTRQIMVWPGSGVRVDDIPPEDLQVRGTMSEAKRERLRQGIIHRWPSRRRGVQLNRKRIQALEKIPHVTKVVPLLEAHCQVWLEHDKKRGLVPQYVAGLAGVLGARWGSGLLPAAASVGALRGPQTVVCFAANADNQHFRNRLLAGEFLSSDSGRSVVVSEYLLYLWGISGDEEVSRVLGKKLRVEYRPGRETPRTLLSLIRSGRLNLPPELQKALEDALRKMPRGSLLPDQALFSEEFTITGVVREFMDDKDSNDVFDLGAGARSGNADVFLPAQTAAELFSRDPRHAGFGFPAVVLTVDREDHVKEVSQKVRSLGLQEYSLEEIVKVLRTNVNLATLVMTFLALVALLVAALGSTNTMIMAVLERTHEIGIMKAVGARDSHIQLMLLVEGFLIGLVGGCLGVLLSWSASYLEDLILRWLLRDPILPPLENTLFAFPLWLTLGTPLGAGLLTMLAAVYPARRATKVNPVMALRHE